MVPRRQFLRSAGACLVAGALPSCVATPAGGAKPVRMTAALTAATHCIAWIGAQAGVFRKQGLDVTFPRIETTGPDSIAGFKRGEWDFANTGSVPAAEDVLNGGDSVIILRAHDPHPNVFVVARGGVEGAAQLDGKTVGVLSDAYSGQTGVKARLALEKVGANARYVGLGTYPNIYAALERGDIEAGALPVHLMLLGRRRHGWRAFETDFDAPSVFATTRRVIAADRGTALAVVRGYVETIHLFSTDPAVVTPLLQRFLKLEDAQSAEELRVYYVQFFPRVPRPDLGAGIASLRKALARYPAAARLEQAQITDATLIDEVERSGFIERLYRT